MGEYSVADFASPQAALDVAAANPGSTVSFVPGTSYPLPELLVVGARTRIRAWGAELYGVDGNHRLLRSFHSTDSFAGYGGPSHIRVEGGVWDCRGHEDPPNDLMNAMNFVHGRDITVVGCTIRNVVGAHAIEFCGVERGRVLDCTFEGFYDPGAREFSEAIQLDWPRSPASSDIGVYDSTPCHDITVAGCTMSASAELGPFGALIGSHGTVPAARHERVRVTGCQVEGSLSFAIRAYGWRDAVISGNHSIGTAGSSILVQHSDGVCVQSNTVRESGRNAFNISGSQRVVVANNNAANALDQFGIWLGKVDGVGDGTTDTLVIGNVVSGAALAAVRLSSGTNRCVVAENLLRRDGGGSTGVDCGAGAGTSNKVSRNHFAGFTTNVDKNSGTIDET